MKMLFLENQRREIGISRSELARRAKMQPGVIGWIETGRFNPYDSQLEKLAEVLQVDDPKKLLDMVEV